MRAATFGGYWTFIDFVVISFIVGLIGLMTVLTWRAFRKYGFGLKFWIHFAWFGFSVFCGIVLRGGLLPGGALYDPLYKSDRAHALLMQEELKHTARNCGNYPNLADMARAANGDPNPYFCKDRFIPIQRIIDTNTYFPNAEGTSFEIRFRARSSIKNLVVYGTHELEADLYIDLPDSPPHFDSTPKPK